MGHFQPKVIAFYAAAISSVLALFSAVTSFGEANLKAAISIDGRYRIPAAALPGCQPGQSYFLTIQQSGIFVNAFLLAENTAVQKQVVVRERPSLHGRWQGGQLRLQGPLKEQSCTGQYLLLEGTVEGTTLVGVLRVDDRQQNVTAQREQVEESQTEAH